MSPQGSALLHRVLAAACLGISLGVLSGGCERKPSAAEIEEARRAEAPPATPTPTPKPGEWMFDKKRKSILDEPARR